MPLSNIALKNRFRKSKTRRSVKNAYNPPSYMNYFVFIKSVQGTGYFERFMNRRPSCKFAEYYVVANADETFDLHGYIQLSAHVAPHVLLPLFNCKTTLTPTTIADKLESGFHKLPDKISIGVENQVPAVHLPPKLNPVFKHVKTVVNIGPFRVVDPAILWLPQVPKLDADKIKIKPFL